MPDTPKTVKCPTCGAPVAWQPENRFRPFCSERCKLIDFGEWADEKRAIAAAPSLSDYEEEYSHD
nr:DNA gyrase inhibitor YacG [uncultured Kingella sp.]